MKYTQVRNLQWANTAHTYINCEVNFEDLKEEFLPFTATPEDIYAHGREIFARCAAGEFGVVAEYVPPANIVGAEALERVRRERDYKLTTHVDPVVSNPLRWGDLSEEQKQAWATYRRALLDITTTYPDVYYVWNEYAREHVAENLIWPKSPADLAYTPPSGSIPVTEA
jgi:hypothetical protein